ncbi:hypothetical protein B296_00006410 [Ensete ventricosum]|uniref:Uncharacterized protein n=1 Tax=Ensete ventricosum TaxID=4639 RepID=A0A427AJP0_ENSVE|nr:hypothetical protein B296_00006410 [Ensete ventricosum]
MAEPSVCGSCTIAAQVFGRLTIAEPPWTTAKPPVPYFQGAFDGYTTSGGG